MHAAPLASLHNLFVAQITAQRAVRSVAAGHKKVNISRNYASRRGIHLREERVAELHPRVRFGRGLPLRFTASPHNVCVSEVAALRAVRCVAAKARD
jgi:hypothetical protein